MYELFSKLGNRVHLTEVFAPLPREAGDVDLIENLTEDSGKPFLKRKYRRQSNHDYPSRYVVFD